MKVVNGCTPLKRLSRLLIAVSSFKDEYETNMILEKKRQTEIDDIINELLLNVGVSFPEDSIGILLSKLGIQYSVAADLPERISGVVFTREGNICVAANKQDTLKRRIFTLAHELGHIILKHPMDPNGEKYRLDQYNYSSEDNDETEANYFAASLLVPKDKLQWALSQTRDISIVARYFGVSEIVIQNRKRWLFTNQC
jgi:Zn-dependent peptidase ImmA (M78 family)